MKNQTIINTFRYNPIFRSEANISVTTNKVRGSIIVGDGEYKVGADLVEAIKNDPSNTYLVSFGAFEHMKKEGINNICMLDPDLKREEGLDTTYGGVIH